MRRALAGAALVLLTACGAQPAPAPSEAAASPATSAPASFALRAAPPAQGGIGCAAEETTIFACDLDNGKRVAVCGAGEGQGRYRYGKTAPELELAGGQYAYTMYSGGGEGQIAFDNAGYRYVVFSRMVRTNFRADEPNYPAMSDGVIVLRGKDFIDLHLCEGSEMLPVQLDAANAVWEDAGELFTDETIRADPEWANR